MTTQPLDILSQYVTDPDPKVRANLATALSAGSNREAADMLARLATEDEDDMVNQTAIERLEALDEKMLADLNDNLTSSFNPRMEKSRLVNWFRAASLSAQSSRSYLFDSEKDWMVQLRQCRQLNRRLRWVQAAGQSIWSRLFNKANIVVLGLPVLLFPFLLWLTISNPGDDVFAMAWALGILTILVGGVPILALSVPPTVPFRRGIAAALDCFALCGFAFFCLVVYWVVMGLFGGRNVPEGTMSFLLFLLVPLLLVRLVLIPQIPLKYSGLRMAVFALAALGAFLAFYTLLHWFWVKSDGFAELLEFAEVGGPYAIFTLPLALMLGLQQGRRADVHLGQTAAHPVKRALGVVVWTASFLFAVGFVFLAARPPDLGTGQQESLKLPEANAPELAQFPIALSLQGNFRLRLDVPDDGQLGIVATARLNDREQDIILWVNNERIDRDGRGPEEYINDKQEEGPLFITAELYASDTDVDELVEYYDDRISRNLRDLFGMTPEIETLLIENTVFEVEINWVPDAPNNDNGPDASEGRNVRN